MFICLYVYMNSCHHTCPAPCRGTHLLRDDWIMLLWQWNGRIWDTTAHSNYSHDWVVCDWIYLPNKIRRPSLWWSLLRSTREPNPPPLPAINSVEWQRRVHVLTRAVSTLQSRSHSTSPSPIITIDSQGCRLPLTTTWCDLGLMHNTWYNKSWRRRWPPPYRIVPHEPAVSQHWVHVRKDRIAVEEVWDEHQEPSGCHPICQFSGRTKRGGQNNEFPAFVWMNVHRVLFALFLVRIAFACSTFGLHSSQSGSVHHSKFANICKGRPPTWSHHNGSIDLLGLCALFIITCVHCLHWYAETE